VVTVGEGRKKEVLGGGSGVVEGQAVFIHCERGPNQEGEAGRGSRQAGCGTNIMEGSISKYNLDRVVGWPSFIKKWPAQVKSWGQGGCA
jgi:hypothetical protein